MPGRVAGSLTPGSGSGWLRLDVGSFICWLLVQGTTGYGWPWGDDLDDSKMPEFTSGTSLPLAEPVGLHPEAASWSGVEDLVGSVYQWTDVFTDTHTSRWAQAWTDVRKL